MCAARRSIRSLSGPPTRWLPSWRNRKNKSDLLAGLEIRDDDDVVADILIDLTRRETTNYSTLYSRTLVGALKSSIKLSKTPERSAGFRVLKAPDIPSVLVELGYLSNDKDQSDLMSEAWREKAIESIVSSMRTFFSKRSAKSSAPHHAGCWLEGVAWDGMWPCHPPCCSGLM